MAEDSKIDFGSVANTALGVSSLIKGLRNKKPKPLSAARFTPNVRPAQGNEDALQRTRNAITDQVGSATRDVTKIAGSDANTGIAARLGIQDNATKALAAAEAENARLYREDQNRVSHELNNAEMINAQMENQARAYNAQVDQANYEQNQAMAAAGVQNSLQYGIDRRADAENKRVAESSGNQMIDAIGAGQYNELYRLAYEKTGDPAKAKAHADAAMKDRNFSQFKTNNYQNPRPWWAGMFGKRKSAPSVGVTQ